MNVQMTAVQALTCILDPVAVDLHWAAAKLVRYYDWAAVVLAIELAGSGY